MTFSVFDIFKIGIGPSSSHTVGPMRAILRFLDVLQSDGLLQKVGGLQIDLYGSLALTGKGHGTDRALLLGLMGFVPDALDFAAAEVALSELNSSHRLKLLGEREIVFDTQHNLRFNRDAQLPYHPNGMCFRALDEKGQEILQRHYYSVGGGFVVDEIESNNPAQALTVKGPLEFSTARELLAHCKENQLSISQLVMQNELRSSTEQSINDRLDHLASVMENCIDRGCRTRGILPGGLNIKRRAPFLRRELIKRQERALADPMAALDWVNLWAMAVNEENASGGQVVTAPTNGAAGIIPAVLRYYQRFYGGSAEGVRTFLLVASAIAGLFKLNASVSGAEVGCQGEVGVACSMAAAGLTASMGGSNNQVENAAEIGMEHNLGLTCDPIGGLVQIPCIERNAMGAVKAIDASRLAMLGDGSHHVSLDRVIDTMRRTGADMMDIYKETSKGGLAVNLVEC